MIREFGNAVQGVAWIGGIALVATALVLVASRRSALSRDKTTDRLALVWLFASAAAIVKLTLLPIAGGFDGIANANGNPLAAIDLRNALGNVLLYVPAGFLAAIRWRSSTRPVVVTTLAAFTFALLVESLQLVAPFGRSADIQDVMLNTVGALLGALAATMVVRLRWHWS